MFAIIVVIYFCVLAGDALLVSFAADDMMNLAAYHGHTPWDLALAHIRFYSTFYRPAGSLYYMPVYTLAGLNPLPYRVVIFLLLLANIGIFYRFARSLTGSETQARIATLLSCYHTAMVVNYYFNSQIYDILCASFYFLAFNLYLSVRARGELRWKHTAAVTALYIMALNAKEMAVTLPVFLLLHEVLFHRGRGLRTPLFTGALTAVYILGKCFGPDSLTNAEAYRPQFTIERFLAGNASYLETVLYLPAGSVTPRDTILFWLVLLVFALMRRNRVVLFGLFWIILSALPVVFIGRMGGPVLYLPLIGWATLVTAVCADLIPPLPSFPRPLRYIAAGLAIAAMGAWHYDHKRHFLPAVYSSQSTTWNAIQQLDNAGLQLPKGARLLFLNDPFDGFDMVFICQLYYRDPSLRIDLARMMKSKPAGEQLKNYDAVLQFESGRIVQAPIHAVTRGSDPRAWLDALSESMPEAPLPWSAHDVITGFPAIPTPPRVCSSSPLPCRK